MDDTPSTPQPVSRLEVMFDPDTHLPVLAVDGTGYPLYPEVAEAIAKGLVYAAALARRHAAAELN